MSDKPTILVADDDADILDQIRLALASEDGAEQRVQPGVVLGRQRMGDDDARHERTGGIDDVAAVLVDVDDEVRRRERAQRREVRILGPADLRHAPDRIARVHAEPRARDDLLAEPQREQQFGEAGDEARDARCRARGHVPDAGPVDERVAGGVSPHRAACACGPPAPGRRGSAARP